mgnify:FL=1
MMGDATRLERLRIGKRIYPVKTTLDQSEARRLESLFDSLAEEEEIGTSQEEGLVLMALKLAHALEKTREFLERLAEREGKP